MDEAPVAGIAGPKRAKRIAVMLLLAAAAGLFVWWATGYYTERVFDVDDAKYKKVSEQGDAVVYRSLSGEIVVRAMPGAKEVMLGGEKYVVRETGESAYRVEYPSGAARTVDYSGPVAHILDENGERQPPFFVYANGKRMVEPGEEYYGATELVRAAYPDYHERQGNPLFLFFAVFAVALGWCAARHEAFVRFQFKLTYGLWVEDPEPTDFYLFMAKIGGYIAMGLGVVFFLKSL